jgi:hypothetical protein
MAILKPKPPTPAAERTRIVLSFAMRNHGANFAHWLRQKLMHHYGLYGTSSVYLDSVVARDAPLTFHGDGMLATVGAKITGAPQVLVDTRPEVMSEMGSRPIGARRPDWNAAFQNAMMEADVMVMVLTNEYESSKYCTLERGQFSENNDIRVKKRIPALRGVGLTFPSTDKLRSMQSNITYVEAKKVTIVTGKALMGKVLTELQSAPDGSAYESGDFIIDETDFTKLTQEIGPLPPLVD